MGGSAVLEDWELQSGQVRTVVLVGKTGNGKSATGNSILGSKAFTSKFSSTGVTATCELQMTVLEDGRTLNVIDTPGLFDFSAEPEYIGKEILKCLDMANEGIHAIIVVLSVRSRYSREEKAAIESLLEFFGGEIRYYMIVVFTAGDDLEENGQTLDDYLGYDCPEELKDILKMCGKRYILFDNKTKDEVQKFEQVNKLMFLVNNVVCNNGGKPFTNEMFVKLKELREKKQTEKDSLEKAELTEKLNKEHELMLKQITETIEKQLGESIHKLQKQLAKEKTARQKAEEAQKKTDEEVHQMKNDLQNKQKETDDLWNRINNMNRCVIQ